MIRLSDIRPDRQLSGLRNQVRASEPHARLQGQLATFLTTTSAPRTASLDRVSQDPAPRAEALNAVAAGLPVSGGEPQTQLPPPIYTKGPHYFCPAGLEGTALDPLRLAEQFMALPDALRGNFFNAICQYNAELGSALNSTLRDIRGEDVQKQWLSHMDTIQGSTFTAEGLPPWLLTALSTPSSPPPAAGTVQTAAPPVYTKGPHYFCPAGFEGTDKDPLRLAEQFMALPDALRGNFFNAICQYNAELGSALNSTLRDIRGEDVQKQWVNHMDTIQGSTFTAEGLPPWLVAALS